MKKRNILFSISILFAALILLSCKDKSKNNTNHALQQIENKESINIKRFDKLLFETKIDNIKDTLLKHEEEYKYLFNAPLTDTFYLADITEFANDAVLKEVYATVKKKYNDLTWLETQLYNAFAKTKKYFPKTSIPVFYSLISGNYDYNDRVITTNEFMSISLDFYVAQDFEKYAYFGLPKYMLQFLDSNNIVSDCMYTWGNNLLSKNPETTTLLDKMIHEGKILYYLEKVIPNVSDELKIRYTHEQLQWCQKNEQLVWSFFIQQRLLFEKDFIKIRAFINEGPKTPNFEGSPARLVDYIGWQIVRKYMDNKNVELVDLFNNTNSQQILKESSYKPKRK